MRHRSHYVHSPWSNAYDNGNRADAFVRANSRHRVETRTEIARECGPVVYALRLEGGIIKIGHTADIASRVTGFGGFDSVIGLVPGTLEDEQEIHRALVHHRARGREYYYPTPEVLGVVNEMRSQFGFDPIS